jgi:EAL domain-containing protein (putative c-di-GMP-specific phosphodiesterase class I)
MIDAALAARRLLDAQGFHGTFASVNLSPVQLRSDRLVRRLRGSGGSSWHGLQLEMTEQHIVDDSAATLADLERLLGFGVELAIDDFGTGYSSLGALHRIPARTLKIDRSLVARSDTQAGRAVIGAVVGVANAFGMTTVGEGVELADQARVLRDLGVDAVQGFLFARPAPLDDFARRIVRGGWVWDATPGELDAPQRLPLTVP